MSGIEIDGKKGMPIPRGGAAVIASLMREWLIDLNDWSDLSVFGDRARAVHSNQVFTGSFAAGVQQIATGPFGDIDLILPFGKQKAVKSFLKEIGIPHKGHGTQISSIITFNEVPYQVDFEFKEYFDYVPTEFSKLSNEWNLYDIQDSIKGRFSKILLASCTAADEEYYVFNVTYGICQRSLAGYKMDAQEKERNYVRDCEAIFRRLFSNVNDKPEVDWLDYDAMWYFAGICRLMCRYYTAEQRKLVLDKFARKVLEKSYEPSQLERVAYVLLRELGTETVDCVRRLRAVQPANEGA